jgi:hypothetical protein
VPEIPNVVPGEPVEASWGNQVAGRTAQRYADATARDASVPIPEAGALSYLQNTDQLYLYDGTDWVRIVRQDASGNAAIDGGVSADGFVTIGVQGVDAFRAFKNWRGAGYMQAWGELLSAVFRFNDGTSSWDYRHGPMSTQAQGGTGLEFGAAASGLIDGGVFATFHNDGARRFQFRRGGAFLWELWARSNTGTWLKVMDARNDNGDLRVGNDPRDGSQVRNVAHSSTDAPPADAQPGDLFLVYE